MIIDIKNKTKVFLLFVLIFIMNFIISRKYPENYTFNYQPEDYEKATSVATIIGYSATSFIIIGVIILLISILKWGITKKFKWWYSDWLFFVIFLLEIIKLNSFHNK